MNRLNWKRRMTTMIGALALTLSGSTRDLVADTCVSNGANETEVCLSWSQPTDPVDGVDFEYAFLDDFSPTVTLITGDAGWNIVVTNIQSQTPGDLISLDIDPTSSVANFGVTLNNGFDAAVDNMGVIDLTSSFAAVRSSFRGGHIGGDLEGLTVQRSAFGVGGEITGQIFVAGNLQGDISGHQLTDAWLLIGGDQSGDISFTKGISDSTLSIGGSTSQFSTIDVTAMSGSSIHLAENGFSVPTEFNGTLNLGNGVPADCAVFMAGQLGATGVIDLQGNDVESFLEVGGGGAGSIVDGGAVTGSGHVWVSTLAENTFTGTATFKYMAPFSAVEAEFSNIDGTINIKGDMDGQLWVRVGPLLENGRFNIGGDLGATGSIIVHSVTGFGGDVDGRIKVGGSIKGLVQVDHNVTGEITSGSVAGGTIEIFDDVSGAVTTGMVDGGTITVGGSVSGTVAASGIIDGFVNIAKDVSGTLRILRGISGSYVSIDENVTASGDVILGPLTNSPQFGTSINIGSGEIGDFEMAGYLTFLNGISADATVSVRNTIAATGIVDLNHGGVAGYADFAGGGTGQFINGGTIESTGHLWLGGTHDITWAGYASFDAVGDWGVIETEAAHIDGTIDVAGDVNGYVVARFGDLGPNANLIVGGNVGPLGTVGSLGNPGSFGHCQGSVKVRGDVSGQILIGEELASTGSIDVDGLVIGQVVVNGETQVGSSIALGGIAASGSVRVNDTQGDFNANGNIVVSGVGSAFQPTVEFDGCIGVKGNGSGSYGDLNGRILVTGCHATADDLNICIDGNVNGAVTIRQYSCLNQVGWSCTSQCP